MTSAQVPIVGLGVPRRQRDPQLVVTRRRDTAVAPTHRRGRGADRLRGVSRGVPVTRSAAAPAAAPTIAVSGAASPPLVRLGLLWAALLTGALIAGPLGSAVLVAPVAMVATMSAARAARSARGREPLYLALAAGAVPLAAIGGPYLAALAAVAAGAAGAAASFSGHSRLSPARAVVVVVGPALAAASVVVSRVQGRNLALFLVAGVCLYDAANHVMGSGRGGDVVGVLSGLVTVGVLAMLAAAVLSPPLPAVGPWVLCGLVAALAPCGPVVSRRLFGAANLPAWGRLDSLMLAGPAWVIGVVALHAR
ncbi:MAG: hypothetical protein ACR2KC_08175 [Acidimicrobiales bacterium]